MDVERLREQIPTCRRLVYMNTGWSGPSPVSVVKAIRKRLEYESFEGTTCPPVLNSGVELQLQAREAVAQFLNVTSSEILLTQNTTEGLNIVLNGFPWREGDEIVTFDIEHPSVLAPCFHTQGRRGVRLRLVPLAPDDDWDTILGKVEGALNSRTRMLAFSHIQFSCGLRMPVEAIRRLTRDREVYMLVDGAQAAGHIPLDMRSLGVDFYSLPSHKWLLGPDGVGALYLRKELIGIIEPTYVAGGDVDSVEEPGSVEVNSQSIDKFRLTTSSVPLAAGFLEAIRFIQEIGVEEIEARNLKLAASLKTRLSEVPGVTVLSPLEGPQVSGLTSLCIDGVDPIAAVERLWQEHRIVARSIENPSGIRISLDFFNTEEEVSLAVEALQSLKA